MGFLPLAGGRLPGFGPAAEERALPAALSNPASSLGGRHHFWFGGVFDFGAVAFGFFGFGVGLLALVALGLAMVSLGLGVGLLGDV